jgi:hypothetical protein
MNNKDLLRNDIHVVNARINDAEQTCMKLKDILTESMNKLAELHRIKNDILSRANDKSPTDAMTAEILAENADVEARR